MAHRLQTTLTPAQEAVAVALRKTLPVSLDDLLAVMREFLNPDVSRSGLDRCLRRHGVGNLRDLKAKVARPGYSGFKAYEPGYLHIDVKDLPQMADQTSRRYQLTGLRAGFSSASTAAGQRPTRAAFCVTWVAGLPHSHPNHTHGQWEGVHRPSLWPAQARTKRKT